MTDSSSESNQQAVSHRLSDHMAFKELEKNLLDQLRATFEAEKTISDELLESLFFIYKNPLIEALNQIDKHNLQEAKSADSLSLVTFISCPSVPNRSIYQVKGSLNYYLFESLNFCACSSYKFNILNRSEFVYCKHMILVKLLKAMNKLNYKHVNDSELIELIKQI